MRAAAAVLVGTHDFSAFRAVSCQARTAVRTVRRLDIVTHARAPEPPLADPGRMDLEDPHWDPRDPQGYPELVDVVVEGDAFLKNMVRILAGTLVDVGRGHLRERDVAAALAARRRDAAGQTAPPEGLTLLEVLWPSSPDSRRAPA
jgi:tRNA pseudouridine38-40 synthase